jgi:hypothetical protein
MENDNKWTDNAKIQRFIILANVISITIWLLGMIFLPTLDRLLSLPAYTFVGLGMFFLIDKYVLLDVDLIYEFKQKNYNVGLWLIAIMVYIGFVIGIIS